MYLSLPIWCNFVTYLRIC